MKKPSSDQVKVCMTGLVVTKQVQSFKVFSWAIYSLVAVVLIMYISKDHFKDEGYYSLAFITFCIISCIVISIIVTIREALLVTVTTIIKLEKVSKENWFGIVGVKRIINNNVYEITVRDCFDKITTLTYPCQREDHPPSVINAIVAEELREKWGPLVDKLDIISVAGDIPKLQEA